MRVHHAVVGSCPGSAASGQMMPSIFAHDAALVAGAGVVPAATREADCQARQRDSACGGGPCQDVPCSAIARCVGVAFACPAT